MPVTRPPEWAWTMAFAVLLVALGDAAYAGYSAPLVKVRIVRDHTSHTPSALYSSDTKSDEGRRFHLATVGAQYMLQKEWAEGYGLQGALAAGRAKLKTEFGGGPRPTSTGLLLGVQLRTYLMVWSGHLSQPRGPKNAPRQDDRPHAITVFVNLRGLYYATSGTYTPSSSPTRTRFEAKSLHINAGVGLMAEFVVSNHVSILPYAWFSPDLYRFGEWSFGDTTSEQRIGLSARQPMRVGVDVWIYPSGPHAENHVALSVLASLIDTKAEGSQEFALVLGYTF